MREQDPAIRAQPVVFPGGGFDILRETIFKTGRTPAENVTCSLIDKARACGYAGENALCFRSEAKITADLYGKTKCGFLAGPVLRGRALR